MKIKGTEYQMRDVWVEVKPFDVFEEIRKHLVEMHPILADGSYLDKVDGYVYVYDYTDGHNNDDHYEQLRIATDKDKEAFAFQDKLKQLFDMMEK